MEQTYAIELQNITKRFGSVIANDKVNLSVKKGEILCVLGENGSGKTTLVNMISGIYYPEEGRITVDGREVQIRSPKDSFDLGIGMVHQHFKLVDILTAAENIVLGLPGRQVLDMKQVTAEIDALAKKYGFDINPEQKIYKMSVSQKQTVEIVKMLYRGARILILDEPTRGIDVGTKTEIQKLVVQLAGEGKSLIFISSEIEEMLRTCSKMAVLRDGAKVGEITEDLTQENVMKAIAGGASK